MNVTVIHVGAFKEEYLSAAQAEYEKRLTPYCNFRSVLVKEEKLLNEEPVQTKKALEIEGERILKTLPKGAYIVALCVEGKDYTSEGFARLLGECALHCRDVAFIIGSSHGLSERVKEAASERLSFSRLTFPHQLLRVMLGEQIYRGFTIINGKKYHK